MKKVLLLGVALLLASAASAQIGLKGGLNAAVLEGEQLNQNTNYNYTYHAGLFYTYNLVGALSVRPELLYSLQGADFKADKEDYETKLHYLTLPLLLDLKLNRLHLLAGPQFGVLLTARQAGTLFLGYNPTTGAEEYGSVSEQVTDQYKKQDFSLCAGAELEISNGLRVGGRFNAGLTDIANYQDVRSPNDPQLKNRVVQAYLALQLGNR